MLAYYCYSRHSFLVGAWLAGGFRVVIGGIIYGFLWFCLRVHFEFRWLAAAQAGIVICGTIPCGINLHGQVGRVVIQRTFLFCAGLSALGSGTMPPVGIVRTFSCGQLLPARKAAVVIGGTIPEADFSSQGCYSRHNLACGRLRRPCGLRLLFAAHFKSGRVRRRISGILHAGLLFSAHFIIAVPPVFIAIPHFFSSISTVVIVRTFLRFTAAFPAYPPQQTKKKQGCYPQHNSMYNLRSVFPAVLKLGIRKQARQKQLTRQNPLPIPRKKFSCHLSCYPAHISKIPKKSFSFFLQPHPTAKIFLSANCAVNNNRIPMLLFAAQFQITRLHPSKFFAAPRGCYPAHILPQRLHFVPKPSCYPPHIVVPGTDLWLFPAQCVCYSAHISVVIGSTALPYI